MAKTKKQTSDSEDPETTQVRMTFGEHLEELRKRIIRSFLGSIFGIVLCVYFINDIIRFIVHPYRVALIAHHLPDLFTYSKPAEPVITYLTLGFQAGLILSSPWIIYQIWCFVAAGVYDRERGVVYRYVGAGGLLFLTGVAFLYLIVLPMTLNFCIGFTGDTGGPPPTPTWIENLIIGKSDSRKIDTAKLPPGDSEEVLRMIPRLPIVATDPPAPSDGQGYMFYNATEGKVKVRVGKESLTLLVVQGGSLFTNLPRLDDYIGFVMFAALVFGLAFEMPMVIVILAQIGIVQTQTFRNVRKYAYFVLSIVSAVAAPSADVMTMMCLMLPLMALYEAGIIAASVVVRRQEKVAESD
jgi:sec-independent protein translocase protein TatC